MTQGATLAASRRACKTDTTIGAKTELRIGLAPYRRCTVEGNRRYHLNRPNMMTSTPKPMKIGRFAHSILFSGCARVPGRVPAILFVCVFAACGDSSPQRGEKKPIAADEDSTRAPKQLELPPLASPDCAAAPPALSEGPIKVQDVDGVRTPATEGPAKLSSGPILGDVSDQSVTV